MDEFKRVAEDESKSAPDMHRKVRRTPRRALQAVITNVLSRHYPHRIKRMRMPSWRGPSGAV